MGISEFWDDIKEMFEVKGFYKDSWESFRKGKNYDAFLYLKNNNELCIRRFKTMSTNRDKKNKKNDELTAQERQNIYNNSYFFKKKNEEAVDFLKKHPIPKEYLQR